MQVRLLRALLEADADVTADVSGNFVVRALPSSQCVLSPALRNSENGEPA
jgi:hypothetical protein